MGGEDLPKMPIACFVADRCSNLLLASIAQVLSKLSRSSCEPSACIPTFRLRAYRRAQASRWPMPACKLLSSQLLGVRSLAYQKSSAP